MQDENLSTSKYKGKYNIKKIEKQQKTDESRNSHPSSNVSLKALWN